MWYHRRASLPPQHQQPGPRQPMNRFSTSSILGSHSRTSHFALRQLNLLHCLLLLITVNFLLLSGPLVMAHAPPLSGYYDSASNPLQTLLTSGRQFAHNPVSPYYITSSNRRYIPKALSLKANSKGRGSRYDESANKKHASRPLTDPYYQYEHHQESSEEGHQGLPIPSCKELRMMWLGNQFSRYHTAHRDNHKQGLNWVREMPEVRMLLHILAQHEISKEGLVTDIKAANHKVTANSKAVDNKAHMPYGELALKPHDKEPLVYISNIGPNTTKHLSSDSLAEKPSAKNELAFGIIHTSPDDGDDDQEELVNSKSIQELRKNKVAEIEEESHLDRNGNLGTFGKFLDNGPENLINERKSVKNGGKGSSRNRFQSPNFPGVWHDKPVIPSVRII